MTFAPRKAPCCQSKGVGRRGRPTGTARLMPERSRSGSLIMSCIRRTCSAIKAAVNGLSWPIIWPRREWAPDGCRGTGCWGDGLAQDTAAAREESERQRKCGGRVGGKQLASRRMAIPPSWRLRHGCARRRRSRTKRLRRGCTWRARRQPIGACTAICTVAESPARDRPTGDMTNRPTRKSQTMG